MTEQKLRKIRILADIFKGEVHYKQGRVYEMPVPFCERWIRRGAAEYVTNDATPKYETATIKHETAKPEPPPERVADMAPEPPAKKRGLKYGKPRKND